jgi:hypothetical protein
VSDGEIQRCQERCQKETPQIHSGKKKGQTGKKAEITRARLKLIQWFETEDGREPGRFCLQVSGLAGMESQQERHIRLVVRHNCAVRRYQLQFPTENPIAFHSVFGRLLRKHNPAGRPESPGMHKYMTGECAPRACSSPSNNILRIRAKNDFTSLGGSISFNSVLTISKPQSAVTSLVFSI